MLRGTAPTEHARKNKQHVEHTWQRSSVALPLPEPRPEGQARKDQQDPRAKQPNPRNWEQGRGRGKGGSRSGQLRVLARMAGKVRLRYELAKTGGTLAAPHQKAGHLGTGPYMPAWHPTAAMPKS